MPMAWHPARVWDWFFPQKQETEILRNEESSGTTVAKNL